MVGLLLLIMIILEFLSISLVWTRFVTTFPSKSVWNEIFSIVSRSMIQTDLHLDTCYLNVCMTFNYKYIYVILMMKPNLDRIIETQCARKLMEMVICTRYYECFTLKSVTYTYIYTPRHEVTRTWLHFFAICFLLLFPIICGSKRETASSSQTCFLFVDFIHFWPLPWPRWRHICVYTILSLISKHHHHKPPVVFQQICHTNDKSSCFAMGQVHLHSIIVVQSISERSLFKSIKFNPFIATTHWLCSQSVQLTIDAISNDDDDAKHCNDWI